MRKDLELAGRGRVRFREVREGHLRAFRVLPTTGEFMTRAVYNPEPQQEERALIGVRLV